MGRVKSTLAGTRLSCRDDTVFFFAMLFLDYVNHQQERDAAGPTDRMPALLVINDAVRVGDQVGVFEG